MTTITIERSFLIRVLEQLDVAQSLLERSRHHGRLLVVYEELRAALAAPATAPDDRGMTTIADRTGGPAFPVTDSHHANGQIQYGSNGMTLRDYFAAHAPKEVYDVDGWKLIDCAEVLGLPEGVDYNWRKHYIPLVAKLSYEYADAMLKARGV